MMDVSWAILYDMMNVSLRCDLRSHFDTLKDTVVNHEYSQVRGCKRCDS